MSACGPKRTSWPLSEDCIHRLLSVVLSLGGRRGDGAGLMTISSDAETGYAGAALAEQLKISEARCAEARSFQRATSEILQVIRESPADAQPVFNLIVKRAVELCGAAFGYVLRFDGETLSL